MRACEGCRRRKIKCDAATTNTWPCSACVRLKLQCVRPNGFDGSETPTMSPASIPDPTAGVAPAPNPNAHAMYEASGPVFPSGAHDPFATQSMMQDAAKTASMHQPGQLSGSGPDLFQAAQYTDARGSAQQGILYGGMPRSMSAVEGSYAPQGVFPAGPLQAEGQQGSSPGTHSQDSYQTDLVDLLGSLKVNEAGTGRKSSPHLWPLIHRLPSTLSRAIS